MLISRLRFFITLICEQNDFQLDKPELNFGIKTLPNLESKFVAADSLIDADIHKYNEDWTKDEALTLLKNELIAIRRRHFYTRKRREKIRLLKEDEAKRKQIHEHINRLVGEPNEEKIKMLRQQIADYERLLDRYQGEDWVEETVQTSLFSAPQIVRVDRNKRERDKIDKSIANCKQEIEREQNKKTPQGFEAAVLQVTNWNPYDQSSVSPFLDIEWMFGVSEGFDIVIGNPPYRQLQKDSGKLAKKYVNCGYETFVKSGDIYCLFYERGHEFLRDKGHLCYITSNKWMRADYGKLLHKFIAEETNLQLLIDFGGVKIFEGASVDTNILLYEKDKSHQPTVCVEVRKKDAEHIKILSDYVKSNHLMLSFSGDDDVWVILSPMEQNIKRKIMNIGTPLGEWNIRIRRGVLTGCNDAFFIDTATRDEILSNCKTDYEKEMTKKLIQPVIFGENIKRNGYEWDNQWIINTHNGVRGQISRIEINDYPAVKQHLDKYWKKISSRSDKGDTPYNLRNCAYLRDFSMPKIIYPETTQGAYFAFDDTGMMLDKTCFMLISEHSRYLQLTLSSKLFEYAYRRMFASVSLGEGGYQYNEHALLKLPIAKNYTESVKTDDDIYQLYGINQEEKEYIEYVLESFQENRKNRKRNKKQK